MNKKIILLIVSLLGLILLIPISFLSFSFVKRSYLENTSANEEERLRALIISSINFPERIQKDTVLFRNAFFICGNTLFAEPDVTFELIGIEKEIRTSKGIYIVDEDQYFQSLDSLMDKQPFYNEEARRLDSLKHKDYLRLSAHAFKISNSEIQLRYSFYSFSKGSENNTFVYYFFYRNGQWEVKKKDV